MGVIVDGISKSFVLGVLAGLLMAGPASAVFLSDILLVEDTATSFGGVTPGAAIPSGHLVDVEFTSPPGVGVFFNSGPWYIAGSVRAYGFFDPGVARIDFTAPMTSVTLAARGSLATDVLGPAAAPPAFPSEPLAAATGMVEALGFGDVVLASVPIANFSLVSQSVADLITFDESILGEPIVAVNLVNASPVQGERSLVVVGAIGVTVPEPGVTILLASGVLGMVLLGRPRPNNRYH